MADISVNIFDSKLRSGAGSQAVYRRKMADLGGHYAEIVLSQQYRPAQFRPVPGINASTTAAPGAAGYSLVTGTLQAAGVIAAASARTDTYASAAITLAAGASPTDNAYTSMAIRITSGTGSGARGTITGYVGATKIATVNWGTGATGAAGVPASLDATSVYELSIDCFNRSKVLVKVEYSNGTGSCGMNVAFRDASGQVTDSVSVTPTNLNITDKSSNGTNCRAVGFEAPGDGFDTAFIQVLTGPTNAAAVSAWGAAV